MLQMTSPISARPISSCNRLRNSGKARFGKWTRLAEACRGGDRSETRQKFSAEPVLRRIGASPEGPATPKEAKSGREPSARNFSRATRPRRFPRGRSRMETEARIFRGTRFALQGGVADLGGAESAVKTGRELSGDDVCRCQRASPISAQARIGCKSARRPSARYFSQATRARRFRRGGERGENRPRPFRRAAWRAQTGVADFGEGMCFGGMAATTIRDGCFRGGGASLFSASLDSGRRRRRGNFWALFAAV
jgi:hypothetical protein